MRNKIICLLVSVGLLTMGCSEPAPVNAGVQLSQTSPNFHDVQDPTPLNPPAPLEPLILNVRDFGAKCDGVSDDTVALNKFLVALEISRRPEPHGVLSGVCKVTGNLTFKPRPGTILEGENGATLLCAGKDKGWCLIVTGGGAGASTGITVNHNFGATSLAVSNAAAFSAGDYILINYSYAVANTFSQGQLNRVVSKNGNSLKLEYPLTFPIDLTKQLGGKGFTATVQRQAMKEGLTFRNIKFDGRLSRGLQFGVFITNFERARIEKLQVTNFVSNAVGQSGFHMGYCSRCKVNNIDAQDIAGHAVYFTGLLDADVSNVFVRTIVGVPLEFTWCSSSTFSNITALIGARSEARVLKTTGSTGNTFWNIRLSGAHYRTGFSMSSGSSYNSIYNLNSTDSSSCVWLNGTGNNNNVFRGVYTKNCVFRGSSAVAPYTGFSIAVAATAPFVDTGNAFYSVNEESQPYVQIADKKSNTVSYRN